ncbi:MAG: cation diffusion facilitator family transporter [Acidimicrobiales bacterium]|nr:cation transporter [Acidimicrobiales bacterium]
MALGHGHSHGHEHSHGPDGTDVSVARLSLATGVNVGFAVVQVVVGLLIGSVVVLADALHQVVDALGLVTAMVALRLARRPSDHAMTFGWGKVDALGAFTSGLLLLGSIIWVAYESIHRLFDPVEVAGAGVIAIGLIGIAINGLSVLALNGASGLSVRAARLHLLIDLGGSVIVVATGVLLATTSAEWLDPVASLVLNAVVLRSTLAVLAAASNELLDRSPGDITVASVDSVLGNLDGVEQVHHVHVRGLGSGKVSVTAHVVLDSELSLHAAQGLIDAMAQALEAELGVTHSTIQIECHECEAISH